jgi:hypothetical protein
MDPVSRMSRSALAATVLSLFLLSFPLQMAGAASPLPEGSEGISYSPTVPVDKVTLVNMDESGIYDDFNYIACVPASVFNYRAGDRTIANPVLFYQPAKSVDDETRTLNTYPGIVNFMEDMTVLSEGELDRIDLVGFGGQTPGEVGSEWQAASITHMDGKDPYDTSAKIALTNWAYSDNAVLVPIIADPKSVDEKITGAITGTTPATAPLTDSISGTQEPSPVDPNFHDFEVGPEFKYVTSQLTWGKSWNPLSDITERGKDPDLQLYSDMIGLVGASEKWNVLEGASEEIDSYLYNPGGWKFAVTYMPTKSPLVEDPEGWGSVPPAGTVSAEEQKLYKTERLKAMMEDRNERGLDPDLPGDSTVEYVIDYTLYPGVDIPEKVNTPFYCRDATFKLEWDDNAQSLGLILRGPEGAEIAVANAATGSPTQVLEVPQLGEGEYQLSVINLGANAQATPFTITYNMRQAKDPAEADSWAGAANGAVLASQLNAPVLFCSPSGLSGSVGDAMNTLGVKNVYLVDPGHMSGRGVLRDVDALRGLIRKEIAVVQVTSYEDLYSRIHELSSIGGVEERDIVFTTMDPWTSWNVLNSNDMSGNPKEEIPGALFVGPAALSGAFHGAPVLVTEAHPELSCANAWHNEFWKYAYHNGRAPPSVACMILTGKEIYSVLDHYGLDVKTPLDDTGKCKESIITVADQFDIGSAWDRALVGAAQSGRIMGHPTDASVWVSRSGLYDKVIFANPGVNPALDETGGLRIQGSSSTRIGGKLVITSPETETEEQFPVAETWVSYQYKFNEQASEYWGTPYTTRTGITPFFDSSSETDPDGIDPGGVYPDLDSSEIVPHYLEQIGYGQAYTTTFEATTENLNRGVIMWLEVMHGGHTQSGVVGWWNENGATEANPWRGYEEAGVPLAGTQLLRMRGATDNPDVSTMSKHIGLDVTPGVGPITDVGVIPERHDGVVIAISQQGQTEYTENGLVMDDAFGNLHSMGFSGGSCLIANTYLHLMMVRHGSVFQVIDPWLTSWYSAFAMNMFLRDLYYGYTVGEAYERGISHVGIEYLVDGWWWDIFENLVYYGDPDIHVYKPNAWKEPESLSSGTVLGGHAPFGPKDHPHATDSGLIWDIALFILVIGAIGAGAYVFYARKKGIEIPLLKRIPLASRAKKA